MLRFRARSTVLLAAAALSINLLAAGCTSPLFRGQSPDAEVVETLPRHDEEEQDGVRLVGDYAVAYGNTWVPVEAVALVTQLNGTGSDPPPSPMRDQLIKEMQTHDVHNYSGTLASDKTAMVVVRGFIPPGAQKGDRFDIAVGIPSRSKTSSLRDGFLMQCRMRERQRLGNSVRTGDVAALARGPIVIDAMFDKTGDDIYETRGRVLGGGVTQKSRPIGLGIVDEHASVKTSARLGAAINHRFYHFDHNNKRGVANPTRDNMIELAIHPRYKNYLQRYLRVIRNIAIGETAGERIVRLATLERMLVEPTSAERAALQLEAIGQDGIPALRKGVASRDPEVRFYSAEALAYLDDTDAVEPLYEAARYERAFRWRALTALSTMNSYQAKEHLARLANEPSAETRYGAFRALRERNPRDPLVRGKLLGNKFAFHTVATNGDPMVHFARSRRPEIVVFGHDVRLEPPEFLFAGKHILIKQVDDQSVRVSRFAAGDEDEHVVCSTKIGDVVETIVEQGGGYDDVFTAIEDAKTRGYLNVRLAVGALPRAGRRYERSGDEPTPEEKPRFHVANPVPEMFFDRLDSDREKSDDGSSVESFEPLEAERTEEGFFGKMTSWWSE